MVFLCIVNATTCSIAICIVVIAFDPTHLFEKLFIRDVCCETWVHGIGCLDVNHCNVCGPFFTNLQQQFSGRRAIGEKNFNIVIDLFLEV